MKYRSVYPVTCAEMDAHYRLTVDGVMTYHEDAVAKYLTTLNLAAFDLQKDGSTWIISEINMDLDMNGHTNNRRYVSIALSCFGREFQTSHRPDTLNIRFLKESRLGDALTVASYPIEGPEADGGRGQLPWADHQRLRR